mgnify:CR=1 FL=1
MGAFRLFPGLSPDLLANVLQPPLQGLALLAFGVGNGPDRDDRFLAALAEATARDVGIVAITQCTTGGIDLERYAVGRQMAATGVISAPATAQAANAKSSNTPPTVVVIRQRGFAVSYPLQTSQVSHIAGSAVL